MSWVFATELLKDRRVRVGHSFTSLAAHLGVSAATVRAIEGGAKTDHYELGLLLRYADALGLELLELFEPACTDQPGDASDSDAAAALAVLVGCGGSFYFDAAAAALGWTPERVRAALNAAVPLLEPLGMRLSWQGDVEVKLVGAVQHAAAVAEVSASTVRDRGLYKHSARLLIEIARLGTVRRSDDPVATAQLLDAGLVEYLGSEGSGVSKGNRATLGLSDAGRYNLCIDGHD